jgi:hypothetical protein
MTASSKILCEKSFHEMSGFAQEIRKNAATIGSRLRQA